MNKFRLVAVLAVTGLLVSAGLVAEEIYKSVDENGRITFSSSGGDQAEKIEVKEPNVVVLPKVAKPEVSGEDGVAGDQGLAKALPYTKLVITKPEEAVTEVRGVELPYRLDVNVMSEPALQSSLGHRYQFYFDGKPVGKPSTRNSIAFADLYRGSYQVSVAIVDTKSKNRELIRSESAQINIRQSTAPQKSPR